MDTALKNIETASTGFADAAAGMPQQLDQVMNRLETTLDALNRTSDMLEKTVWINAGTIMKAVEHFERTTENMSQLTLDLRKYPGRILLERPPEVNTPERIREIIKENEK